MSASTNSYRPWNRDAAVRLIAEHEGRAGPLLPILHALQAEFGYIDPEAEPMIGAALNITRAEVHGVVTFYRDFRRAPPGRHHVQLCRAEACQARGSDALAAEIEAGLGIPINSTAPDGSVTYEAVYCLGLCASGPAVSLDGRLIGRVEADEGARRVVGACRA